MQRFRTVLAFGCAMALAGCMSTRGAQDIACPAFDRYVEDLPTSAFLADIQCEADGRNCSRDGKPVGLLEGAGEDSLSKAIRLSVSNDLESGEMVGRNHLLLSGGGQWGAYGAGLFAQLHARGKLDEMDIGTITGVSTGGLQSLLLAVALEPGPGAARRAAAIAQLTRSYDPKSERELVRRNKEEMLAFTGSVAGTAPLRRHLMEVLCEGPDKCSLVDDLRKGRMKTFIGFVEARSGRFRYFSVRRLFEGESDNRLAADCLAAAAMASAAMPVFHQQLRVTGGADGPRTLFDGGVRQSVFLAGFGEKVDRETRAAYAARPKAADAPLVPQEADYPIIYVVRNGPTTRDEDLDVDSVRTAMPQGKRAYDLIVNELEVGSIAALRLANPYGPIMLTTADGWNMADPTGARCDKGDRSIMFNPSFMRCLQRLGAAKAARDKGPWWPLSPIIPKPGGTGGT